MVATPEYTIYCRDELVRYDLVNDETQKGYYPVYRYRFRVANEGIRYHVYRDTKGLRTVGVGFNMDAVGAIDIWKLAFKGKVSFEDVHQGKRELSYDELFRLYVECSMKFEGEIIGLYGTTWQKLKANERMAMEDLYFVGQKLVNNATSFYKHILNYAETGEFKYLREAVYEVRERSNKGGHPGVQNRREIQALMLSTFDCPDYIGKEYR